MLNLFKTSLAIWVFLQAAYSHATSSGPSCSLVFSDEKAAIALDLSSVKDLEIPQSLIQDLQKQRPLPAVFRSSARDANLKEVLIRIFKSCSATEQMQIWLASGFRYENGKLEEVAPPAKAPFETTRYVRNLMSQKLVQVFGNRLRLEVQTFDGSKPYGVIEKVDRIIYMRYHAAAMREILNSFKIPVDSPVAAPFVYKIQLMVNDSEYWGWFALNQSKVLDGANSRVLHFKGPQDANSISIHLRDQGVQLSAEQLKKQADDFELRILEIRSQIEQATAESMNTRPRLSEPAPYTQDKAKKPVVSLPTLVKELGQDPEHWVAVKLRDLLIASDSRYSEPQAASELSNKSEIELLKLAYASERERKITKAQIIEAVEKGLDEATKPSQKLAAETPAQAQQDESANSSQTTPDEAQMDRISGGDEPANRDVNHDAQARLGSINRLIRVSEKLHDKFKFRDKEGIESYFTIELSNQKEFFDILKLGSSGFEHLEKSFDEVVARLGRVVEAYHGVQHALLLKDGHSSLKHKGIFSVYHGSYRLLVGLVKIPVKDKTKQSEPGQWKARLVILTVYKKSDSKSSQHTEEHHYELAEKRMHELN